jgi:hypothetical protein
MSLSNKDPEQSIISHLFIKAGASGERTPKLDWSLTLLVKESKPIYVVYHFYTEFFLTCAYPLIFLFDLHTSITIISSRRTKLSPFPVIV